MFHEVLFDIKQFHDDGEKGLGDTVASLSMGAPASMKFRVKAKREVELQAKHPMERFEEEIDAVTEDEPRGKSSNGRVRLEIILNHGDIMIMKGADIQEYWEVCRAYLSLGFWIG